MTPTNKYPTNAASDPVKSLGDKIADVASQVKDKVSEFGRTSTQTIEDTRTAAASGLASTASALHQGGEKVTSFAHSTADKLNGTAEYLRSHDMNGMMANVRHFVKKNPTASLLAAGAIGFFLARTLRRSD